MTTFAEHLEPEQRRALEGQRAKASWRAVGEAIEKMSHIFVEVFQHAWEACEAFLRVIAPVVKREQIRQRAASFPTSQTIYRHRGL